MESKTAGSWGKHGEMCCKSPSEAFFGHRTPFPPNETLDGSGVGMIPLTQRPTTAMSVILSEQASPVPDGCNATPPARRGSGGSSPAVCACAD